MPGGIPGIVPLAGLPVEAQGRPTGRPGTAAMPRCRTRGPAVRQRDCSIGHGRWRSTRQQCVVPGFRARRPGFVASRIAGAAALPCKRSSEGRSPVIARSRRLMFRTGVAIVTAIACKAAGARAGGGNGRTPDPPPAGRGFFRRTSRQRSHCRSYSLLRVSTTPLTARCRSVWLKRARRCRPLPCALTFPLDRGRHNRGGPARCPAGARRCSN